MTRSHLCRLMGLTERGRHAWKHQPASHRQRRDMSRALMSLLRMNAQGLGPYPRSAPIASWQLRPTTDDRGVERTGHSHRPAMPVSGLLANSCRAMGSQDCAHDYQKLPRTQGFKVSMSGKGNCYDNSAVESFLKSLKAEVVWRRNWQTRRAVEVSQFEYMNGFYNPRRKHSALA